MADNVPRFMQSTKASQEKLSEAATNKKTKIPMFAPSSSSSGGGGAVAFTDLLVKEKRRKASLSSAGEGNSSGGKQGFVPGTMHPFEPEASRDAKFGLGIKEAAAAGTSIPKDNKKQAQQQPQQERPNQPQPLFPEIAFPPLHESFTNPQPIVEAPPSPFPVPQPQPQPQQPHTSIEGVASPAQYDGEEDGNGVSSMRPTAQPSPTHMETLDQVAQAEAALADMESLLCGGGGQEVAAADQQRRREEDDIVASVLGDASGGNPDEAQVLHALTVKDGPRVDATQFARLIDSVCGEAIAKMVAAQAQAQSETAASAAAQQQNAATVEALQMRAEVARLQAAGAAMLANMHSIVGQMRNVVTDPLFIEESLQKAELNREFSVDLVAGLPQPASSPRTSTSVAGASSVSAAASVSNNSSCSATEPSRSIQCSPFPRREPGEPTPSPMEPAAATVIAAGTEAGEGDDDEAPNSSADAQPQQPRTASVAPLLFGSPSRVQQLKQRLVKNGLRELLIDMTQEQAATATLLASPETEHLPEPVVRNAALQAAQVIRDAQLAPVDEEALHRETKGINVPAHAIVRARVNSLNSNNNDNTAAPSSTFFPSSSSTSTSASSSSASATAATVTEEQLEHEVDDIMAELSKEQGAIAQQMREKREQAKLQEREVAATVATAIATAAVAPASSSLSVVTSPQHGSGALPVASPLSANHPARSPRLAELMKLELVKCMRQLQKVAGSHRAQRRARTSTHKHAAAAATTDAAGSGRRGSATSRHADAASGAIPSAVGADGAATVDADAFTSDEEDYHLTDDEEEQDSTGSSASSEEEEEQVKRVMRKKPRSRRGSEAEKEKAAAAAAAAEVAQAQAQAQAAQAEAAAAAAKVALEEQKLSLERERLAWEGEKLRLQQKSFAAAQAAATKAAADAAVAVDEAAARAAAAAAKEQADARALEFERMKLAMEAEQMRMEHARRLLDQQMKEVAALKEIAEKAAAAPLPQPAPMPVPVAAAPVPVHVVINHAPEGMRPGQDLASAAGKTAEDDGMTMKRNLAKYLAKREEKRARHERRAARKAAKEQASVKEKNKASSRRNSLSGLPLIGAVSTTPADTALVRSGHHRHTSSSASGHLLLDAPLPVRDEFAQMPLAPPVAYARGSTRNLLQPWSLADLLSAPVPLKLYPSLTDILSLPSAEERVSAVQHLALTNSHAAHDQAYRAYLDPSGAATEALLARELQEASAKVSHADKIVNDLPWLPVTPSIFLSLTVSLVDLHKLTFLSRPRPVIEIYSVRSGRPQLVFESEFAPAQCTEHHFAPMLLRLDELCYQQLERDILLRVTSIAAPSSSSLSPDLLTGGAAVRTLVGEVWTNLFKLQSCAPGSRFPVLRPRPPEKAHKGPKEKGTLVVQGVSLFVRSSAGLLAYPDHPNRCLPLTYPAIFERVTECQLCFTVQCRSLAALADAKFAEAVALRQRGASASSSSSSSSGKKAAHHPPAPRVCPYLEFYRLEEEGVWSKKPVFTTEEVWAGSSLANAHAANPRGKTGRGGGDNPHATLTWRPVQMDLFALCFGDVRRNVLVKVMTGATGSAGGALGSGPTLLASFQFQVAEVLARRDAAVVVLDPRASASNGASAAAAVQSHHHHRASFLSEGASPANHPAGSPTSPRGGGGGSQSGGGRIPSAVSPATLTGEPATSSHHAVMSEGSDKDRPACILFQRVHVYSSIKSLPALVSRAGITVAPDDQVAALAAKPEAKPLAKAISGLHQIMLEQEKRRARATGPGSARSGFAAAVSEPSRSRSGSSSSSSLASSSVVAAAAVAGVTPASRRSSRAAAVADSSTPTATATAGTAAQSVRSSTPLGTPAVPSSSSRSRRPSLAALSVDDDEEKKGGPQ